jgi:hypothetical protein
MAYELPNIALPDLQDTSKEGVSDYLRVLNQAISQRDEEIRQRISQPDFINVADAGAIGDGANDDTAALQSAIDAIPATGGRVVLPRGDYRFSSLDFKEKDYITFEGQGTLADTTLRWTNTTGPVLDLSNCRFIKIRNLNLIPTAEKTAGAVFNLANADDILIENIRIASGLIGFDILNGSSDIVIRHVRGLDHNASWDWSSLLRLTTGTGQSSTIILEDVFLQSATTVSGGAFSIADVDTFIANRIGFQKQGAGVGTGVNITGGTLIHIANSFFEGGAASATGLLVNGGTNIHLLDNHCAVNLYGLRVASGDGVQVIGGRYYFNNRNGIRLEGGTNIYINGAHVLDNSNAATNSWDGIFVAAGVSEWKVQNSFVGKVRGDAIQDRYSLYVAAGASDNYAITGNRFSDYGTGGFFDGGTGTSKVIRDNLGYVAEGSFITLADDATPSVLNGKIFLTGGTTAITDFDDGVPGQIIMIIAEHSITITDGTSIFLNGSANFAMQASDTLTLICKADGKWYELSRSVNV